MARSVAQIGGYRPHLRSLTARAARSTMTSVLTPVAIHYRDPVLVLASWEDFFFQHWRDEGRVEHVRRMFDEHQRFVRSRPTGTYSMAHIRIHSLKPPDEAMREVMRQHQEEVGPVIAGTVTVIEADGFAGAVLRGVVSGLSLLNRTAAKQQVQKTALDGMRYLVSRRPASAAAVDPETLTAHYLAAVTEP